ncbi:hypothetical protein PUS82_10305 [Cytobacillus firmus]|uniref:hypothetical protein n=1 Tax=Cytobacillus firmus TaxID=1399 RepID=UPI0018CCA2DD|nr:hypothetical protein [Cytobacillus firmus]MBG9550391.1 hypothetical protein [Cytobacillus firmus]MBG9604151.1 hypothetical protein [Cytobacillus firmus]MBG9653937.1 hypothetical protein [Cytobacillus firmus]MDD9311685.1 hypothetical protein [Cytobacillus firmus]
MRIKLILYAATYVISALVLFKMKWQTSEPALNEGISSGFKEKLAAIGRDLKEVYSFILLKPMLLLVNIVFLIGAFAGASHNLGIPLLAEEVDSSKQSFYYGLIWGVLNHWVLPSDLLPRLLYWKYYHWLKWFGSSMGP